MAQEKTEGKGEFWMPYLEGRPEEFLHRYHPRQLYRRTRLRPLISDLVVRIVPVARGRRDAML